MKLVKVLTAAFLVTLLSATANLAVAYTDVYEFKTPEQEQLFQELSNELRCPKCQNNSIADSNAGLAEDLRKKTYEMVSEGKSKNQILDYMIGRYGNFITYDTAVTPGTLILWAAPFGFILIGFTVLVIRSRKNRAESVKTELDNDEEVRLAAILDAEQSNVSENKNDSDKTKDSK
ncbi:cytochrome c-type biogenesis protein CcmH [Vibrio sp. SS-MA-C1-2]|uniref:cytochrome c-type biogenesis protein n=1 Tax=Vibrio sp. SS-MA-C1-2 TaxID=2908646 RepID=UPI001F47EDDF|nr:cytochrome c-type biogenesis protein [Vibrio sp. SS-MA-C1-2]UJF18743.1 cytochrome c-type biogenesis protein CcmH [Vibrio sp. SS-MA-C1-2]